jgi:peroxiredoxin
MTHIIRSTFVAAAALALSAVAFAAAEIAKPAPDFTLTDTKGVTHRLADFKGKVVVLEWINLGCPYVKAQYSGKNMQNVQKAATAKGVVWLSVCSSASGQQGHMSPADWNTKIAEHGIASTAVLIDESGSVGKAYGAKTTPHMFVVAADGTLAYAGAIDTAISTNTAEIAKAQNYVTAAVDALLAGKPVATSATKPYGCGVKYK